MAESAIVFEDFVLFLAEMMIIGKIHGKKAVETGNI